MDNEEGEDNFDHQPPIATFCNVCRTDQHTSRRAIIYMASSHGTTHPFACPRCRYVYTSESSYDRHFCIVHIKNLAKGCPKPKTAGIKELQGRCHSLRFNLDNSVVETFFFFGELELSVSNPCSDTFFANAKHLWGATIQFEKKIREIQLLEANKKKICKMTAVGRDIAWTERLVDTIQFVTLAERIIALQGCQDTIFVPTNSSSTAQSKVLTQDPLLQIIQVTSETGDLSSQLNKDAGMDTRKSITVTESVPALRSVILDMDQRRPPVLRVYIFETDAFDVADELGVLKYILITTTAIYTALKMYLPALDKQLEGAFIDLKEPIQIPGCKSIQIYNLKGWKNDRYNWLLHQASRYAMTQGFLINTCEELEPLAVKALEESPILKKLGTGVPSSICPVGRVIRLEDLLVAGNKYLDWLDNQLSGSVFFVSIGSGKTLSTEQITELAWGLERSQQRILWVVREPTKKEVNGTYFNFGDGGPSGYLLNAFVVRTHGVGLIVPSSMFVEDDIGVAIRTAFSLTTKQR